MDVSATPRPNLQTNLKRVLASVAAVKQWTLERVWSRIRRGYLVEWALIIAVAYFYTANTLLDFNASQLQRTGKHHESATLLFLIEHGLKRDGQIPLWNHYMLTGFPLAGDPISPLWNPVSTLPVLIWGAINGMKVAAFLSFVAAGLGQWWLAHVFGARGAPRLWAGVLFMLSGGLALLWRLGWYELLLGMAWFPWCFATLWWALEKQDRLSLLPPVLCGAMVLTAEGTHYPVYLLVSAVTIAGVKWLRPKQRWRIIRRALTIAGLSIGLTGIVLLPLWESHPYITLIPRFDPQQQSSQSIPYALINYIVSKPEWLDDTVLGNLPGYNWHYIGWLPVIALVLLPAAWSHARRYRLALSTLGVLAFVLLAWHADLFAPLYGLMPFLSNVRSPNVLLILASSPLMVMASLCAQYVFGVAHRLVRGIVITIARPATGTTILRLPFKRGQDVLLALGILIMAGDVFAVNKSFAFAPDVLMPGKNQVLQWLKHYNPGLYYISIGGDLVYYDWAPAAYQEEVLWIRFEYGRRLAIQDKASLPGAVITAKPAYLITLRDLLIKDNVELVSELQGFQIWRVTDALPFAFSVPPHLANLQKYLAPDDVTPLTARLDGPNRIVVNADAAYSGERLVIEVLHFPGWQVYVDGQPSVLAEANHYLGVDVLPGKHNYTFVFQPVSYTRGLAISLLTLAIIGWLIWAEVRGPWNNQARLS